jgi:hypothetical protein
MYEYRRKIFLWDSDEHKPLTRGGRVIPAELCEVICLNPGIESTVSVHLEALTGENIVGMKYGWTG